MRKLQSIADIKNRMIAMMNASKSPSDQIIDSVALKLFINIADEWALNKSQRRQLFLWLNDSHYNDFFSGNRTEKHADILRFVSHLIAIYKLLHQIFSDINQANSWMTKPNSAFERQTAFELIHRKGEDGVLIIRKHLEAQLR